MLTAQVHDERVSADWASWLVQAEYHEMPGLRLTAAQACCLFDLDHELCHQVLDDLCRQGFLRLGRDGRYARTEPSG